MQPSLTSHERTSDEAQPLHPLFKSALTFLGLALLLAASAFVIRMDVIYNQSGIGENSLVEHLQETYMFIVAVLFAGVGLKQRYQRGFAVLVSAFFSIVFIRELDSVFDQISHGLWKYPAWLIATVAIINALSHKETTFKPLINYTKHRSFGMMLAGMATLLVFARIYGMGDLWQSIMQDDYIRPVKNLAEEGVELLAYSLVLFAAAWYCLPELVKKKQ